MTVQKICGLKRYHHWIIGLCYQETGWLKDDHCLKETLAKKNKIWLFGSLWWLYKDGHLVPGTERCFCTISLFCKQIYISLAYFYQDSYRITHKFYIWQILNFHNSLHHQIIIIHHNYLTRDIAIARKIAHSIVLHVRVDHLQKMILNNILVTSLIPSPPLSQLESLSRKFFVQILFSFLLISCLDIIPLTLYWS